MGRVLLMGDGNDNGEYTGITELRRPTPVTRAGKLKSKCSKHAK
jgi:hypothetical protein